MVLFCIAVLTERCNYDILSTTACHFDISSVFLLFPVIQGDCAISLIYSTELFAVIMVRGIKKVADRTPATSARVCVSLT